MNLNEMTIIRPGFETTDEVDEAKRWFDSIPHRLRPWFAGTTAKLTPYLRECCQKMSDSEPVVVKVEPFDGAGMQRCYANVETVVELFGGTAVTGWKIWHIRHAYYNFEHHCVWRPPDGELVCVTPQMGDEQEILFLPQKEGTLDEIDAVMDTLRFDASLSSKRATAMPRRSLNAKRRKATL